MQVCIAYENSPLMTRGGLPLLAPMSEVAGRMSVQAGAHYLEKSSGWARGVFTRWRFQGWPPAKVFNYWWRGGW